MSACSLVLTEMAFTVLEVTECGVHVEKLLVCLLCFLALIPNNAVKPLLGFIKNVVQREMKTL